MTTPDVPCRPVRPRLIEVIANLKHVLPPSLRDEDDFINTLGLDSMDSLNLLVAIEATFEFRFAPFEPFDRYFSSFGELLKAVEGHLAERAASAGTDAQGSRSVV